MSRQAPWRLLLWLGMLRDAINTFLPVARVGGELIAIRVLRLRGMKVSTASASVIVETSVTLVLQVFLTLLGIMVLLPDIGAAFLIPELLGVFAVAVLVVIAFLMVQVRIGLVAAFDRTLGRLLKGLGYTGGRVFVYKILFFVVLMVFHSLKRNTRFDMWICAVESHLIGEGAHIIGYLQKVVGLFHFLTGFIRNPGLLIHPSLSTA
jgi:hypothetical protein